MYRKKINFLECESEIIGVIYHKTEKDEIFREEIGVVYYSTFFPLVYMILELKSGYQN